MDSPDPGYNILGDSVDPSSEVTVFIVESEQSNYRYDEHVALTIERGESVVTSLVDALDD